LLGLAIAIVGETPAAARPCAVERYGEQHRTHKRLRVVDFSSLWAGPLCGSVFAAMGAGVVKIESLERPDTTARAAPLLHQRLNGAKHMKQLSLRSAEGLAQLSHEVASCDVLITSARARALTALGFTREALFAANPALIWIAITGHGWTSNRIAFGDDAAVAGGLVAWNGDEPRFIGDAVADPLTGLAAAACALEALANGGGAFIDAALAQTAATVAAAGMGPR
jgi:crotonobetainyl-CoA:carnitine CoA-transferase CaiB-like acyl-CoA transferase